MALRITQTAADSTAVQDASITPFGNVSLQTNNDDSFVQNLIDRAGTQLLSGATDGYLELFREALALAPRRRYEVSKLLLERGLSATRGRGERELVTLLAILAEGVIALLETEPAEPLLLNYAGVIFYELWSLDAAKALFVAARRLDPELLHLKANLENVRRRKATQSARAKGRRFPVLHPAIPELSRRALRIAPRAQAARGLRMSLCMIVKDEEEMLGRCLAAAAPAVDDIIIVDTGSTDRTIEIAHQYGALVLEREWTGSFSDARNVSFDAATGDWILYLDADEVLNSEDADKLRGLRGQTWREAFFLHETNFAGHEESGVSVVHSALRVFRNRPEYRFKGRLHEQIAHALPSHLPERIAQSEVRVEHYGYLSSVRAAKEKSRRNVELLLAARADGGAVKPFDYFNLGSEYLAIGNWAAAVAEFEAAWQAEMAGDSGGRYVPTLAGRYVSALRQSGRHLEALERAAEGLARFPDFTDLVYEQGLAYVDLGRTAEATESWERCITMGDAPSAYTSVVGSGTFLPRIALAELNLRDGNPDAALVLLRWCASSYPDFFGTYGPYVRALLRSGRSGSEAVSEIEAVLTDEVTSMIRFVLATTLIEEGAVPEATAQLRMVLERRPDNLTATELLMETLLLSRDFEQFQLTLVQFKHLDLDERERHERLAQMYLRHGFLRSAARQWMEVVNHQPDPEALRGLAEVARRNGQTETAATFSAEALKF